MRRTTSIVLSAGAGAVCALACLFCWLYASSPPSLPDLTMEHFESNWNRWAEPGPANYDIEVEVRGPQAATYHVEVRDGEAISATRDDYPLKGPRTIGTWSVVGMFHTMEIDLDQLVLDAAETSKSARLLLDCRFDPEWGFPTRYRRIEVGSQMHVEWQVISFTTRNAS